MSKSTTEAMIAVGAVLPGTDAVGEDRDTITARHYAHPGLDGRVVVRLVPAVLGRAEDLTCEFLGFDAPGRTAEVGTGRRSALGFPAWALVHDPANAHHALNLVKDVERLARTARSRAGAAKDGFTSLGDMLGRSAPHFLPTFYEQAGRIFLEHGNPTYAASMFGKAREAEEVHDLAVDPERTREVFLEFAFAGALTAKALSSHAKGLARKHDPDGAYELFLTLCVERTRGGLPPYTGMPEDLRRLAKGAKRDLRAEDERLLRAVLDSSSISRAGIGFWKSYRDSLVAVATADAEVRGQLLSFVPATAAALDTWLSILAGCGATRALIEPPGEVAVAPAEWLSSVIAVRASGWRGNGRSQALLELVDAMAGRLVADGVPVRVLRGWRQGELDLLDLFVARGVPIAPGDRSNGQFDVSGWLSDDQPGRRDLAALAASEEFGHALGEGLVVHARSTARKTTVTPEALSGAIAVPGLRVALRGWLATRAGQVAATGLPDLGRHLDALAVLRVPEAFADVPEAAEALAATDVAAALHRTLRTGLLDELGWPALEEALTRLAAVGAPKDEGVVLSGEGWPALVLRRGETFIVVGPDGILAEHVARIPADARHRWAFRPTADWHDGVLLVRWYGPDREMGYWSDAPDRIFQRGASDPSYSNDLVTPSIALPDGARFSGRRAVHRGDTEVPARRPAIGDGTTTWTAAHEDRKLRWFEVDPATGETGRTSLPRFVEDFTADGTTLHLDDCDLRPSVPATGGSPLGEADGLHGWRVRTEADGSWLGEGVDGRRVRMARGTQRPVGVLRLPGGGQLVLGTQYQSLSLLDEDGTLLGSVSTSESHSAYAAGTPLVVPLGWWHVLKPRDEAGSAALRGVTRKAVEQMLTAALAELADDKQAKPSLRERLTSLVRGDRDDLTRAVTTALPGLTSPGLLAGVLDVVRRAAAQLRTYRGYGPIAKAARSVDLDSLVPSGPAVTEEQLNTALGWFGGYRSSSGHGSTATTLPDLITALAETAALPKAAGRALPETTCADWFEFLPGLGAIAHRAASPLTSEDHRAALVLLLRCLADSGMAEGGGHWRTVGYALPKGAADPKNRVVPVADGFIAVFQENWRHNSGHRYDGIQFTRTPGAYDVPRGWVLENSQDVDVPFGRERITRFLDVLAERGPAPWRPEAVPALVERTGLGSGEATVLLAGMPGVDRWDAHYLSTAERHLLDLSAGNAKAGKERLKRLGAGYRRRLLAAALPADPADLWTTGPDVEAVAAVWTAEHGHRSPVPDDVLVDAAKRLTLSHTGEYVTGVVNPDSTTWLTTDCDTRLEGGALESRNKDGFTSHTVEVVSQVLPWLAQRLPVGSPLRARLPEALALARRRIAHPGFIVEIGSWVSLQDTSKLLGIEPPAPGAVVRHRPWLTVVGVNDHYCKLFVTPGQLVPQDRDLLVAISEGTYSQALLRGLDVLADEGVAAACAVTAPEGVDPDTYYQDPTVSVPHLVAQAAARFGLDEDAAALYLQLLALPDPTDANVARWTGWKPARLKKARAALAATDLVLTAKRARAGRTLFLPGGWLNLGSPHLPLESWKTPMFGITDRGWGVLSPREPVAALFARAWQRVVDGDTPAYEELKTGGRR
ncbi:hypothetical protein [Umezawaea sp. Da 62-37]|uniref:hypothetical protein n=1 Tax=Umezawaea sp. Da 62-37 TaxID=3075927 RepID=UPI0028F72425|nr:hypothetical protein [Umezawaea sp. Da 62-37]WNV88209.1 hypothetical protein RM788_07915 [Umezawaea sp. Da 62-37]